MQKHLTNTPPPGAEQYSDIWFILTDQERQALINSLNGSKAGGGAEGGRRIYYRKRRNRKTNRKNKNKKSLRRR